MSWEDTDPDFIGPAKPRPTPLAPPKEAPAPAAGVPAAQKVADIAGPNTTVEEGLDPLNRAYKLGNVPVAPQDDKKIVPATYNTPAAGGLSRIQQNDEFAKNSAQSAIEEGNVRQLYSNQQADADANRANETQAVLDKTMEDRRKTDARVAQKTEELDSVGKQIANYQVSTGKFFNNPGNVISAIALAFMPFATNNGADGVKYVNEAIKADLDEQERKLDQLHGQYRVGQSTIGMLNAAFKDRQLARDYYLSEANRIAAIKSQELGNRMQGATAPIIAKRNAEAFMAEANRFKMALYAGIYQRAGVVSAAMEPYLAPGGKYATGIQSVGEAESAAKGELDATKQRLAPGATPMPSTTPAQPQERTLERLDGGSAPQQQSPSRLPLMGFPDIGKAVGIDPEGTVSSAAKGLTEFKNKLGPSVGDYASRLKAAAVMAMKPDVAGLATSLPTAPKAEQQTQAKPAESKIVGPPPADVDTSPDPKEPEPTKEQKAARYLRQHNYYMERIVNGLPTDAKADPQGAAELAKEQVRVYKLIGDMAQGGYGTKEERERAAVATGRNAADIYLTMVNDELQKINSKPNADRRTSLRKAVAAASSEFNKSVNDLRGPGVAEIVRENAPHTEESQLLQRGFDAMRSIEHISKQTGRSPDEIIGGPNLFAQTLGANLPYEKAVELYHTMVPENSVSKAERKSVENMYRALYAIRNKEVKSDAGKSLTASEQKAFNEAWMKGRGFDDVRSELHNILQTQATRELNAVRGAIGKTEHTAKNPLASLAPAVYYGVVSNRDTMNSSGRLRGQD